MNIDEYLLIQEQQEHQHDPFLSFMYGLKAEETRRQWPKRLKKFLDFGVDPKLKVEQQSSIFYEKASKNEKWASLYFEKFIQFQKERVAKREIESSTIRNYYKAAKLLCDMNDITLNWKRLAKGLAKQKQAADDRSPTLEEIKKLIEYPDKRIKPIVYTMLSSGIRKEAWDHLKWKHIIPIVVNNSNINNNNNNNNLIAAAKIIVYAGDNEEYFSFITPEAYNALKEWMDFRAFHGEKITGNSWVMRNLFTVSERSWKMKRDPNHSNNLGDIDKPVQLSSDGVKSMIERAIHSQGLWTPLEEGSRRREWKGMHGFRKFFKTQSEKVMKSLHVEMLLGHNTGLARNYYRPNENEILNEYYKAIPFLTINDEYRLSKQVQELKQQDDYQKYIIDKKMKEKDEELEILRSKIKEYDEVQSEGRITSKEHTKRLEELEARFEKLMESRNRR